jgi:hypothetical protein
MYRERPLRFKSRSERSFGGRAGARIIEEGTRIVPEGGVMRRLICLGLLLTGWSANGAEPPVLPPPQAVEPQQGPPSGPSGVVVLPYHRVSAYYAVDRKGVFRPRIIDTPYGAFRAYDGKPYPWVQSNGRYFMPYVVDPVYRAK